jgi:3-oxoadipate enol-lactonase
MQVASNGSTFNCRVDGREGAPWVMLAHGLATDLTMWDELTDALKERYRVLRYDARGHGNSAQAPGDYSMEMLVADAIGIMDALGIEKVHFGGLSMGGTTTLVMALKHPDRLKSAVVADARHTTTAEFTKAWQDRAALVRQNGVEVIVDSTVERWSSAGLQARNPAVVERMRRLVRGTSANGYCGGAAALAQINYGHRLGEIRVPTLLICGTEDHGAPPDNTRQMHQSIKGSRFVAIEQAGHISNVEHPRIFNEAVVSFLNAVESGTHRS